MWIFLTFIFFFGPFIFTTIVNRMNKSYKFQHSTYIILALETTTFLYLSFLVRVPEKIEFNFWFWFTIMFAFILVSRLVFNVPPIRLFFMLRAKNKAGKKKNLGFETEEDKQHKVDEYLEELVALNFGISFLFVYIFTSFTILGSICIVNWTDFGANMGYLPEELMHSVYYFIALFCFFIALLIYNKNWIQRKVASGHLEDINIDESSIIFLNHNWNAYTYMAIWFIINFIQV